MARPKKTGLDYFPLDCYMDEKIDLLEAEYKLTGFAVYIKLLQLIYRTTDGQFKFTMQLNDQEFSMWKMLGKKWEIDWKILEMMIEYMVNINLFDKTAYKSGFLTSDGIRHRLLKIYKLRIKDRSRKETQKFSMRKTPKSKVKQNKEKRNILYAFKRPTVEEIAEYCKEINSSISARNFFDFNEMRGWVVGKNKSPMKDWKAAIRTWTNNQKDNEPAEKIMEGF